MSKLKLIPLYLVYLSTFGLASWAKLSPLLHGDAGAPEWFEKQFSATFLNAFPGALSLNFYLIAALELTVTLGLIVSLVKKEFLPGTEKTLLKATLLLAQFVFVMLGFGLRLTQDFAMAANLFFYFGLTWLVSRQLESASQ